GGDVNLIFQNAIVLDNAAGIQQDIGADASSRVDGDAGQDLSAAVDLCAWRAPRRRMTNAKGKQSRCQRLFEEALARTVVARSAQPDKKMRDALLAQRRQKIIAAGDFHAVNVAAPGRAVAFENSPDVDARCFKQTVE